VLQLLIDLWISSTFQKEAIADPEGCTGTMPEEETNCSPLLFFSYVTQWKSPLQQYQNRKYYDHKSLTDGGLGQRTGVPKDVAFWILVLWRSVVHLLV
jgi:hypothetical protein